VDLLNYNEITPAVNQIETHPFFQREDDNKVMQEYGVQHESWAPFAEGKHDFFKNEILTAIGNKYGKSVAQVTLRWMIQRNIVVIPKSVTPSRIKQNFEVFDFELSQEDMNAIKQLDLNDSSFINHRDPETAKMFLEWSKSLG
jgi:2,5-diketo-D-gluconate reductase A